MERIKKLPVDCLYSYGRLVANDRLIYTKRAVGYSKSTARLKTDIRKNYFKEIILHSKNGEG